MLFERRFHRLRLRIACRTAEWPAQLESALPELWGKANYQAFELLPLRRVDVMAHERGEKLGLNEEELAFYDALGVNDSAVHVLGDDTLKTIACELAQRVRKNATIDWTVKESVRAKLRVLVRKVLRKYGYPPDKQEQATRTVLEQAERIAEAWAA